MKIYKKIITSTLIALMTVMVVYGGYAIYAADGEGDNSLIYDMRKTDYTASQRADQSFYRLKASYHYTMNNFFNDKFKLFIETVNAATDFSKLEELKVPEKILTSNKTGDERRELISSECDGNLSSYCVSMESLYLYIDYITTLKTKKRGKIDDTGRKIIVAMDKETEDAQIILKAAVAVYNQFIMAYPLHKEYEVIIKDLVTYKNKLKKIRMKVVNFPAVFVDLTSTKCP